MASVAERLKALEDDTRERLGVVPESHAIELASIRAEVEAVAKTLRNEVQHHTRLGMVTGITARLAPEEEP